MKRVKFKYHITAIILVITAVSCQKVIDLKLRNDTGKLVIEGNIVNRHGQQTVKLSRNIPFTGTNIYPPVSGAVVTVSDSLGTTFQFTERAAGTYTGNLPGVPDGTYALAVTTGGQTYAATSVMPQPVQIDSITAQTQAFNKNKNRKNISVYFQDPPGVANQYRFILTVNGVQVNNVFAFSDDFFDGRYVSLELFANDTDIEPNDTVVVEMQCVDKPVYTYWFSLMQQNNGPGGGVSPSNPPTNISPTVLGYFSAHTSSIKTMIVQ
jgi:hypothetical protein